MLILLASLSTPICNCYTDNIKHGCILLIINDRSINRVIIYGYIILSLDIKWNVKNEMN